MTTRVIQGIIKTKNGGEHMWLSLEHDIIVSVTVKPLEQFCRYQTALPYYQNVVWEGIRYTGA